MRLGAALKEEAEKTQQVWRVFHRVAGAVVAVLNYCSQEPWAVELDG
jgi:hypothetical protein